MPKILAVKENNMSSPFSKSFLSKNPISLTQKQEDNLPTNLVKEIAKEEEKKETPLTMVDYTDYGTESGYVSTRASIQNMFDGITKGTLAAMEGLKDPQKQADRLGRRVARRNKKAEKISKGKEISLGFIDEAGNFYDKPGEGRTEQFEYDPNYKRYEFDEKTKEITERQKDFQSKADADMQKRIEQAKSLRSASARFSEDFGDSAKSGYDSVYGEGSWDKATDEQKEEFIKR